MPQSMESLSLEAVTKELPEIQQLDHEDVKQNEARLTGRLVRKFDYHLLPVLCLLYLLSYLDRSNIGNAKLGGLEKDLDLTQSEYQWSLSIFYFGYVIFDLPSNIIMRRWRPSYWFGILMCAWGAVATAMAACRNFTGLAIARFLLGTFEAGFFPGVIYFMSLWYTRKEYARRVGFFWSFGSLAGAFGGLIAYGISQIPTHTVATWQWLFIIEGAPSVLLSVLAAWYLPNKPEEAKFLTDEERKFAVRRLAEDAGVANDHSWSWKQVASVFSDWKTYVYMAIYILGSIAVQGVTLFLPSIIAGMGEWSLPVAQALTTPPYVLAFVSVIAIGYSSDKFFERALHLVAVNLVSFAGFTILMFVSYDNVVAHYAGACLVTMAVYSNVTVKVAWFNNNFGGLTRRAVASAAIVAVGTIGGAIGGQIYFDPPHYFAGSMIAFACMVAQTILVIGLRITLARENKRRDQLSPEAKEQEIFAYGGVDLAGDRHPDYRYVL